jgi:putative membrane protein
MGTSTFQAAEARSGTAVWFRASLWVLCGFYGAARITQAFPERIPMVAIVALHVLPPLAFALLHGARVYGVRGMFTFVLCCFLIGNLFENLGVRTGFPFGQYQFTGVMGPKLFDVPILLGLAYIGMGYVSWTVARLILGDASAALTGRRVVTRPLAAAFVMVAWDLSMDAIWANLVHGWTWHRGGAYFGVPLANFFGWYLTVYLIYQSFAVWLWRARVRPRALSLQERLAPALFYGASAAGNLWAIGPPGVSAIRDATGVEWPVSGILGTSALVSVFVMGAFTLLACVKATEAPVTWDPRQPDSD